jgi:hypothetical protein
MLQTYVLCVCLCIIGYFLDNFLLYLSRPPFGKFPGYVPIDMRNSLVQARIVIFEN